MAAALRTRSRLQRSVRRPDPREQGQAGLLVFRAASAPAAARLARRHARPLAQGKRAPAPATPTRQWLAAAVVERLAGFSKHPGRPGCAGASCRTTRCLLIPGLLTVFSDDDKSTAGEVAGGALSATGPGGRHYALIYAECKGSPLEDAGQKPVFDALARELDSRAKAIRPRPGNARHRRGPLRRGQPQPDPGEMSLLTNISLALSALLMLYAFRRLSVFLYLVLPIVTATVWSLVVCFAVFPTRPRCRDRFHDGADRRGARLRDLHAQPRAADRRRLGRTRCAKSAARSSAAA